MYAVLFDEETTWLDLLPLTFTRPVSACRFGILTIAEKWKRTFGEEPGYLSRPHLSQKFPGSVNAETLCVNGAVCPDEELAAAVLKLKPGQSLYAGKRLLACVGDPAKADAFQKTEYNGSLVAAERVTDLFTRNGEALAADFGLLTKGRVSEKLSATVTVIGDRSLVFLEKGAQAEACIINTTAGPVYIGEHAVVMEGAMIRGPFALGPHGEVKMGAKIYGPTTVGPYCKVGGEVNNSIFFGFCNKAHDGYLGNSVIGEWCNLGADTNSSNLKNNYSTVKLFSYRLREMADTGLQFCGLIMGDHSKSAINTMFNTGTVVGVAANVFDGGFPPTHVPSFSWGGSAGFQEYRTDKMIETATRVYGRRGLPFTAADVELMKAVKALSAEFVREKSGSRS